MTTYVRDKLYARLFKQKHVYEGEKVVSKNYFEKKNHAYLRIYEVISILHFK